ncbi:two pore domain potassium channel family protein [Clostridium sp. NSJ-6]|uniref:Two pore domain potassium channel family protein n=1 Tax=Clostridium hominis TaxID=2763036 RepID=A0ABR7DBM4_9CLOT|nr:potassium channel family protein [Clostridium hominis]MBC5628278.1 two pore domain potassium channel family protein [Clostridium hominis]MDU2671454.1 potassium channel family protein [Clostridium sp.]
MGKLFIIISTLLLLSVIGARNAKNNKRIFTVLNNLIKEVNVTYKQLFKEKSKLRRSVQGTLIIAAEIFIAISISTSVIRYIDTYAVDALDLLIKIVIIIMSLIVIHYSMGYVLLITVRIHKFIYGVENKNVKVDLLLSYFIISTYFTALLLSPEEFESMYVLGLIGVTVSYILNMKVLIQLIRNPHNIKTKHEESTSYSRIIVAAILMVGLIVLNLFLGVCFINGAETGAFSNSPNAFDLFYYTIITFTTIGYGDITPLSIGAKVISIVISVTSVICLTIFLSTILSYKDSNEN